MTIRVMLVDDSEVVRIGLAAVLLFVGIKMSLVDIYKIPTALSLAVVLGTITASIVASLVRTRGAVGGEPLRNPGD